MIFNALKDYDIAGSTIDIYSENLSNGLTEEENLESCLQSAGISRELNGTFDEDEVFAIFDGKFEQFGKTKVLPSDNP